MAKALLLEEGIAARDGRVEDDFGDGGVAMGGDILFEVGVRGAEDGEGVPFEVVALHFV